jgi:hypothetical protein
MEGVIHAVSAKAAEIVPLERWIPAFAGMTTAQPPMLVIPAKAGIHLAEPRRPGAVLILCPRQFVTDINIVHKGYFCKPGRRGEFA